MSRGIPKARDLLRERTEELADLRARLQRAEEALGFCDECNEPKLPGFYRCYFCGKRFCGPHGAPHFKREENPERLRELVREAQEERDAAIERAEVAEAKLLEGGTVVFTGLSVPKQELDKARAELAAQGDKLRVAEADAKAKGALAEERGALIDAIIRSVEQDKELWTPELRAKSGIPELEETPCPKSDDGHCDHWYDDEGPCCHCGGDVLRLEGVPAEAQGGQEEGLLFGGFYPRGERRFRAEQSEQEED